MMKSRILVFCTAILSATLFYISGLAADELPKRKPGLWEIGVSTVGGAQKENASKQCIDENTDAELQKMAAGFGENCAKKEMKKEGEIYVIESDCNMMGSRIVSKAVFTGDFNSSYSGEATASYDPPLMGQSKTQTKISAKFLGKCEADQKPGDIIMPNGMKMNLKKMLSSQMKFGQ